MITVEKSLKKVKKIAVIVDMQNDFIDGSLGSKEAVAIVEYVNKKIAEYREAGDIIIFTRDTHDDFYPTTMEGKNLPVEHCMKGTHGWQISSELDVRDDDIIVDKPTFGSFELLEKMAEFDFSEVEIMGLCTDICVHANAVLIKTKFSEKEITVDSAGCAGVTPERHNNALDAMKSLQIKIK